MAIHLLHWEHIQWMSVPIDKKKKYQRSQAPYFSFQTISDSSPVMRLKSLFCSSLRCNKFAQSASGVNKSKVPFKKNKWNKLTEYAMLNVVIWQIKVKGWKNSIASLSLQQASRPVSSGWIGKLIILVYTTGKKTPNEFYPLCIYICIRKRERERERVSEWIYLMEIVVAIYVEQNKPLQFGSQKKKVKNFPLRVMNFYITKHPCASLIPLHPSFSLFILSFSLFSMLHS